FEFAQLTQLDLARVRDDYLPDLAARNTRILEVISGENPTKYRLARESLVRIVTQLDQETTRTADNAHIFFLDQYERWNKTKNRHDLLRGNILKLAAQCARTSYTHSIALNDYIDRSRAAQKARRGLVGLSVLITAVLAFGLFSLFGTNRQ